MIEEVTSKRKCALPSEKIEKFKRKISESIKKQNAKITQEALQATVEKMHKWIADHSPNRVSIKSKPIQLFAKNQGSAKVSKKVEELALFLQKSPSISIENAAGK